MYISPPSTPEDPTILADFISDILMAMETTDEMVYTTIDGKNIPAMEYIIKTVDLDLPLKLDKYYLHTRQRPGFKREFIRILRDLFFNNTRIQNNHQCLIDGNPEQCINHWLDRVFGEYHSHTDDTEMEKMVRANLKSLVDREIELNEIGGFSYDRATCKMGDKLVNCIDRAIEEWRQVHDRETLGEAGMSSDHYARYVASPLILMLNNISYSGDVESQCQNDAPDASHNETIPCIQKILMNKFEPDYYRAISANMIGTLKKPIFRQSDGQLVTGYDWLSSDDIFPTIGLHALRAIAQNRRTDLSTITCSTDDGGNVALIDRIIDQVSQLYQSTPTISDEKSTGARKLIQYTSSDVANAECIDNGAAVPCIVKLLNSLGTNLDIVSTMSIIVDELPTPLHDLDCTTYGVTSCIDLVVANMTSLHENEPRYYDMLASIIRDLNDSQSDPQCGPEKISCLEYIASNMQHLEEFFGIKSFMECAFAPSCNIENIKSMAKYCPNPENCLQTAYPTLISSIQESTTAKTNASTLLTQLDAFDDCSQRATSEKRRSCYDYRCFELTNAFQTTPWTKNYLRDGMTYRQEGDPFSLCGIYDIEYIPAKSQYEVRKYRGRIMDALYAIESTLNDHVENVRIYDHTTRTATAIPTKIQLSLLPLASYQNQTVPMVREDVRVRYISTIDGTVVKESVFRFSKILSRFKLLQQLNKPLFQYVEQVVTRKPSENPVQLKLIVSNRPNDIMRATTCQRWSSCFDLGSGAYRNTVHSIIDYNGYVAYLAKDEYEPTWLARVYLLPCDTTNNEGKCIMIQNEVRNYAVDDTYAFVLYDAVNSVLYNHGFNTDECPERCYPLWFDDLAGCEDCVGFDEENDNIYYDDYDDYEPNTNPTYGTYTDNTTCARINDSTIDRIKRIRGNNFIKLDKKMSEIS